MLHISGQNDQCKVNAIWSKRNSKIYWGGRLGPVVMSCLSSGRFESRRDLAHSEAGRLSNGASVGYVLEHCANYYMPPTTTYMFSFMHVGKYISYLPVGVFLRALRFPRAIKLTATIWPKMLKVALNTNPSIYCSWLNELCANKRIKVNDFEKKINYTFTSQSKKEDSTSSEAPPVAENVCCKLIIHKQKFYCLNFF